MNVRRAIIAPLTLVIVGSGTAWIEYYVNSLFVVLLMRSGLQVLMDHPRLYWNAHCTPGTEWIRFTPVEVPRDRVYTAKETLAICRRSSGSWGAATGGAVYVALLFVSGRWHRLIPTSWSILPAAWNE